MLKLRDYQIEKRDEAIEIMRNKGIVYIAAEVRTGKTLIALSMVNEMRYGRCLFLTTKVAISGIEQEYLRSGFKFYIKITNYEQAHNLSDNYDVVILDEVNSLAAFPKPSLRAKRVKERYFEKPLIMMTGTPNPESYSQLFHQFWVSIYSPWHEYVNFYKWAKHYVDVKKRMRGGFLINDYKKGHKEKIMNDVKSFMVNLSQEQAGFSQFVDEEIIRVNIDKNIYLLMDVLKRDKIYKMKSGDYIMADTPVRAMSTFHQLCSGTIKTEEGNIYTLDRSKINYIKHRFKGQK
jgi:hypothetical protein